MSKNNTLINPLIKARIEKYINTNEVYEKGCVISVYDGIAVISGADDVMLNELVQFENGTYGVVFNLNIDSVSVVLLGEYSNINEGSVIKRTKKIINALVGDELLGRVIDPLCNPIDGKGNINTKKTSPIEQNAHSIFERAKIDTPLETGIFLIDTIFPIGLGQRELIIGDSQTGKTTIAINTIINQRGKNINCIYVSIGQKKSSLARIINKLSENNALEYTTIVSASASDLPSLKYIAPFVGITIAEE
jgi:F-type H+-transporting ATPase subunit alpha